MKAKTIPQKIVDLLSDMKAHHVDDVFKLLGDDLAIETNIHAHLTAARKIVAKDEKEIICQMIGRARYYRTIWNTDTSPRLMEKQPEKSKK